jgi:hypothetical protein
MKGSDRALWARHLAAALPAPVPAAHGKRMTNLEQRYARYLDLQLKAHLIASWSFEAIRLKLAPLTTYTPDFWVAMPDGKVQLHEVKGPYFADDAKVKLKIAAANYPLFEFFLVRENSDCSWQLWPIRKE